MFRNIKIKIIKRLLYDRGTKSPMHISDNWKSFPRANTFYDQENHAYKSQLSNMEI